MGNHGSLPYYGQVASKFPSFATNNYQNAGLDSLSGSSTGIFDEESLVDLGNMVGRTVKVDPISMDGNRSRYARVFVEVDLNQPLMPSITVFGESQIIEYEGLHSICFVCGRYGHKGNACSEALKSGSLPVPPVSSARPTPDNPYGPWMLPKQYRKKPTPTHRDRHVWPHSQCGMSDEALREDGLIVEGSSSPAAEPTDTQGGPSQRTREFQPNTKFDTLIGLTEDNVDLHERITQLKRQVLALDSPDQMSAPKAAHRRGEPNNVGGKAKTSKGKTILASGFASNPSPNSRVQHAAESFSS